MRRMRSRSIVAMASSVVLSLVVTGGAVAQGSMADDHPLVGTWVVATDAEASSTGTDLYLVHADGTVTDVTPDGPAGVGSWLPEGDRGAIVTILSPQSDEDGVFTGHRIARGGIEVADDGATFAGTFTVELAVGAEGASTGQLGPLEVTGRRVVAEAPAEVAPPTTADPLTPAPRSRTDCAGQPVVLAHARADFWITGDCPDVRVEGRSIDVYAEDIGTLLIVGDDIDVRANAVGSATLQGRGNDLVARSVGELVVLGTSNDVEVRGPIESVVIDGSRNDVSGRPIGTVVSNGRFNDIGRR